MDNWVLKRVKLTPERTAVYDGRTRYTFAQVFERARKLGSALERLGTFRAQNVAMLADNTIRGYLLSVTLLLYGKTVVWLNKRLTDSELQGQMRDARVECCLKDDSLSERLPVAAQIGTEVRIIGFDEIFAEAGMGECELTAVGDGLSEDRPGSDSEATARCSVHVAPIPREFDEEQTVSIMFTSGSTGAAKGVRQTVRNHVVSATGVALNLGADPGDEWLCAVPIFHISGYSIILRGLIFGVTVRLMDHFDASRMERILTDEPVTWVSVVPTMLKQLVSEHERSIVSNTGYSSSFKGFILGGEKSDASLLQRCARLGMVVVRTYGMTETCSQIVGTAIADGPRKPLCSGKPYFTTSLKLDESTGEILVKTGALTPGYINGPGVFESKRTADGWYRTGDVGHFDDDGYLYVDGRLDNMLISGGEHVFPEEIERVYGDCPDVDEIAVTAESDETWGEVPVAYVVAGDDESLTARLREFGRARLPHHKVPRRFYRVKSLPRTSTGKIRRFLLGR